MNISKFKLLFVFVLLFQYIISFSPKIYNRIFKPNFNSYRTMLSLVTDKVYNTGLIELNCPNKFSKAATAITNDELLHQIIKCEFY